MEGHGAVGGLEGDVSFVIALHEPLKLGCGGTKSSEGVLSIHLRVLRGTRWFGVPGLFFWGRGSDNLLWTRATADRQAQQLSKTRREYDEARRQALRR